MARNTNQSRYIELKKFFGARARTLVVKAPLRSIRENAPSNGTIGSSLHYRKVAEHLIGRRTRIQSIRRITAIQRTKPSLCFKYCEAVTVAPILAFLFQRSYFGFRISQEKNVRDVLTA